ncbi:MAG TPA: helix-turn-helix domain-containing protein [Solirubrobacterales bacterium]|nr:helix-turn-helix domain-containing protein [Solirubrobacterales bacterium]
MLKAEERSAQRSNGWLEGIADPVRFAVVQVLVGTGTATIADLAESCGASVPTIRRHLAALIATGIVAEEDGSSDGCTVGRPASRYKLPKHVRSSAREILDVGGSVVSS